MGTTIAATDSYRLKTDLRLIRMIQFATSSTQSVLLVLSSALYRIASASMPSTVHPNFNHRGSKMAVSAASVLWNRLISPFRLVTTSSMGIPKQDERLQASSHRQSPCSQANLLSLLQYPRHAAVVRGHLCRVTVQMIPTHKTPMAAPSDQTPLLLKSTCDTTSLWYLKVSEVGIRGVLIE